MRAISVTPTDPLTGRRLGPTRTHRLGADETPVPDGPPDAVLAWVGYDPDRAKAATVAEYDRDHPRENLLRELNERTGL